MDRSICIVGAGEFEATTFDPPENAYIVAADGGYRHLQMMGVTPHLLLGDLDSLGERPSLPEILVYPTEKDDTDMGIAAKLGLEKGYNTFYLYGATGGSRPEHTVANLQTLCMLSAKGARAFILQSKDTVYTAVTDGEICFEPSSSGFFSVFCMGAEAEGVTVEGAKYSLSDAVISPFEPLGVSNEFTGRTTLIRVRKGTLLIVWHGRPADLKSL